MRKPFLTYKEAQYIIDRRFNLARQDRPELDYSEFLETNLRILAFAYDIMPEKFEKYG